MANLIELDLKPDDRTLRQFGWIALGGFALLTGLAWFDLLIFSFGLGAAKVPLCATFAGIGIYAALASLVFPRANLPVYLGLTLIAFPIGFVLSYVIMGTLFYVLITPVGLLFRLTGRDAMKRSFESGAPSYFVDVGSPAPRERYFKQY